MLAVCAGMAKLLYLETSFKNYNLILFQVNSYLISAKHWVKLNERLTQ